jgi:hypothetical protein
MIAPYRCYLQSIQSPFKAEQKDLTSHLSMLSSSGRAIYQPVSGTMKRIRLPLGAVLVTFGGGR